MLQALTFRALALVFILTLLCPALAGELDDKYLQILNSADQAEELQKAGKTDAAKAKYLGIQKALLEIKKADPTWKANMVAYRLKDVEAKLGALSPKSDAGGSAPAQTTDPVPRTS